MPSLSISDTKGFDKLRSLHKYYFHFWQKLFVTKICTTPVPFPVIKLLITSGGFLLCESVKDLCARLGRNRRNICRVSLPCEFWCGAWGRWFDGMWPWSSMDKSAGVNLEEVQCTQPWQRRLLRCHFHYPTGDRTKISHVLSSSNRLLHLRFEVNFFCHKLIT